jgi:hypothetical protein
MGIMMNIVKNPLQSGPNRLLIWMFAIINLLLRHAPFMILTRPATETQWQQILYYKCRLNAPVSRVRGPIELLINHVETPRSRPRRAMAVFETMVMVSRMARGGYSPLAHILRAGS